MRWPWLLLVAACDRRPHVEACGDNLHGVWVTPAGERWMVLDNNATLEGYPLFDDSTADGAPRVVDLTRALTRGLQRGAKLDGELHRRYAQREHACEARTPLHVTSCAGDQLELVVSELVAPTAFAPCAWPAPPPAHVEIWRRE